MDQQLALPSAEFSSEAYENADFQTVAGGALLNVLPEKCTRGEAVEMLSRQITANEYGLPLYFIRTDLLGLDRHLNSGHVPQDEVDMASEMLYYQDGYPTFRSGSPFWTQMPHEPHNAYLLFQRFLDLAESEGIRLVDTLARQQNVGIETIRNHYGEFFWSSRARAYDLFLVAADAKKREVRTRKAENAHYEQAGILLDKLRERLTDEKLDELGGKELMDAFEQMVKVQRLSLGLTGQNASSTNKDLTAPGSTVELLFRQLTKNSGQESQGADSITNRLGALMANETDALAIQELIIKATSASGH